MSRSTGWGRVVAVEGPPGNGQSGDQHRPCATTAYDVRDNVVSTANANNETTAYQVDKAGRVSRAD